jgi:hypothetical protein
MVDDPAVALGALHRLHPPPGTPHDDYALHDPRTPPANTAPICYLDDEDILRVWTVAMLLVQRKVPRLSAPHLNG